MWIAERHGGRAGVSEIGAIAEKIDLRGGAAFGRQNRRHRPCLRDGRWLGGQVIDPLGDFGILLLMLFVLLVLKMMLLCGW